MRISPIVILSVAAAEQQQPLTPASFPHLPIKVAALGDSYSAGLGSGRFLTGSNDGRDNACARMDGSYPWLLSKLNPFHIGVGHLPDFVSCSGNRLVDIDKQIQNLQGRKFDAVTLSISGNDFTFGQVIVSTQRLGKSIIFSQMSYRSTASIHTDSSPVMVGSKSDATRP